MRYRFLIILFAVITVVFNSCEKDDSEDDFQEISSGNIEVDAYRLILEDYSTYKKDTFGYGELSKSGGLYDTVLWNVNPNFLRKYFVEIEYFNNGENVTSQIRSNGTSYTNCFRSFSTNDLRIDEFGKDSENNKLGLTTEWSVDNNVTSDGRGTIRITLNYQSLEKTELCDSGVRLFEARVPYRLVK